MKWERRKEDLTGGAEKISVRERKILFELRSGSGSFLGAEWGVKQSRWRDQHGQRP